MGGLTLNKKKCQFNHLKISFYRVVFSPEGISPGPEKFKAIKEAKTPETNKVLRSFLGTTSYRSRYFQTMQLSVNPSGTHTLLLSNKTTIIYFNPNKATEMEQLKCKPIRSRSSAYSEKQGQSLC